MAGTSIERINFDARRVIFDNTDMGILDGPVEVSYEVSDKEINDDRVGPEPLGVIRQAIGIKVKATFKEIDSAFHKKMFSGSMITPVIPGVCSIAEHKDQASCVAASGTWTPGTEVLGCGTATNGTNLFGAAKRLVLQPMSVAAGDHSKDTCFWLAIPKQDGGDKFSANEERKVSIEFTIIPDETKPTNINKFVIGDYTQFVA